MLDVEQLRSRKVQPDAWLGLTSWHEHFDDLHGIHSFHFSV